MIFRYIFLLLLLPGTGLPLAAQYPVSLWFHQLGKKENLLNPAHIHKVFQDSEGFTWIGSESGLDRFDGHTVVHYLRREGDSTSLQDNRVYGGFFEDSRKNIWFCSNSAIQCYHRAEDRFSSYRVKDPSGGAVKSGYTAVFLERDSVLWLRAGNRQIYWFNIHTGETSRPVAKMTYDIEVFPGATPDGALRYLFSVDGSKSPGIQVMEFDASRQLVRTFRAFEKEPALHIHTVVYDNDTAVWLGADSGLYRWNLSDNTLQTFSTGRVAAKFIIPGGPDKLLGTERGTGLFIFDKRSGGSFEWPGCLLLSDPSARWGPLLDQPYLAPGGTIWIKVMGEGLIYAHPAKIKFRSFPKYPGFGGALGYEFRTMLQAPGGQIWCSTFFDGIFLLDSSGKLLRHYHPGLGNLPNIQVSHMLLDRSRRLWVAFQDRLAWYNPAKDIFEQVPDDSGAPVDYPVFLYQLRNGDILAATLQKGLFRIEEKDGRKFMRQIMPPESESDFLTSIYEDDRGHVYISRKMSEIGVFTYTGGALTPVLSIEMPGFLNGFYEKPGSDTLWIATTNGLVSLDKASLSAPYTLHANAEGAQYNEIQSLAPDRDGQLWMGASAGIVRFDPVSGTFRNFSLADGMRSRQFHTLAVLEHRSGALWFGGQEGITVVQPEEIRLLTTPAGVRLTEIRVNDMASPQLRDALTGDAHVQVFQKIIQPHGQNTLSFSFTAIDYSDPASTRLEYMLEDVDENWLRVEKGKPGFVRYPRLSPGQYVLRVRAYNSDGALSDEEKTLQVVILPPWYQTWWARGLFFLAAIVGVYLVYRNRVRQIRKEEEFKRKEAEYKQLAAETETAILRLQMNPHFIFNSMNSINNYILKRDVDTASDYLERFSRLMRMILELAAKPLISVADEIEFLERYLETEAMRFEKHFSYSFDLPDDMDPEEFLIPTMILQPFVENAIWHGLSGKEGQGRIAISFEPKGDCLVCRVEDDGVGRKAAQREASGHQSKAIGITKRRLEILEQQGKGRASVEIIDLPVGTRVELILPLL